MRTLSLCSLVFVLLWVARAGATVLPPAEKDEPLDERSIQLLTATNVGLSAVNVVNIAKGGSYVFGVLSIATGVATYSVANSYLDRSLGVDVIAAVAITSGTLAIFRKIAVQNSKQVSVTPFIKRDEYGLAAKVQF